MTQKNSFIEKEKCITTPIKRGGEGCRGSLQTSASRHNSLIKNIGEFSEKNRKSSISQEFPFEIESSNWNKTQNMK